ncbi:Syntaxin-61 [Phytophthora nicotianae]|uniref:Mannosyltransferase n=1 Tax=Phytophthora nicotianae TaxID=4792 RepID=A0A0W8D8G2_PHYNI|nr:Syntaxin-61 [Phytophthora nicotianae]
MFEELPTTRIFWVSVVAFRLWNALFVRTSFNPDEYWQSTEVAHRLVFGYGYLTWEWQDDAQLRGFAHPALFAGLYKLLELLEGADKKNDDAAPVKHSNRTLALVLAALGVLFRPTNAVIWLYPGIVHFLQTCDHAFLMFGLVVPIAIVTTLAMLCIDRLGYGEWTFVPFNFFKFNVLEGYPAIVGTTLPIAIAGYLTVPPSKKDLGRVILWALFVYSNAAHKEFRFVLPLLPPAIVYSGYCLRNLERKLYVQFRDRTQWNLLRLAVFSVILPNVLTAYYLSRSHQRAPVEVMDYLADRIQGTFTSCLYF